MRISGGEWCGRKIKVPPGDKVRPTQDRVREALFSMLMEVVPGAFWIDLFAGSGSVGLEALSRGAQRVIWVDKDARNLALIRENIETLGADAHEMACADVFRWLASAGTGLGADLIFADPPYILGKEQGFSKMLALAAERKVLKSGGLFIAEMPDIARAESVEGWSIERDRLYGHTRLVIYRRGEA